jgi:hypothetical protein
MREPRATLVLPCLAPADWQLTLWLSSPSPVSVRVDVNGQAVGEAQAAPQADRSVIHLPRGALFRGDNIVSLGAPGPGVRLHRFTVRPAGTALAD